MYVAGCIASSSELTAFITTCQSDPVIMTLLNFLLVSALVPDFLNAMEVSETAAVAVSSGGALLQVQHQMARLEKDRQLNIGLVLQIAGQKRTEDIARASNLKQNMSSLLAVDQEQKDHTYRQCPLPANATWCQVRLTGLPPYMMAVRSGFDVVSNEVCTKGFWENQDFATFGAPGNAMDIGGNMGYFTFALAQAGWSVITFEPMKANLDLIAATMCANPNFAQRVEIHKHGLGNQNTQCRFVFHKGNVGNGITRCKEDTNMWWEDIDKDFRYGDDEYQLRKFDEVLGELQQQGKLKKIDFLKIDVEGYECEVLKGAPQFLANFAPKLVKTEVWPHLERCEPVEYLTNYLNTGYTLARDVACVDVQTDLAHAGGDYFLCKK